MLRNAIKEWILSLHSDIFLTENVDEIRSVASQESSKQLSVTKEETGLPKWPPKKKNE